MNKDKLTSIQNVLSKQGYNIVSGNIYDMQQIWKSWYRGNVNDFHHYKVKTIDGTSKDCEKLTFGLPKIGAEEWSSLLWNERVQLSTNNETVNERIMEVLEQNDFDIETSNLIEKVFGYAGTGAFVEFLVDGETTIDYISGEFVIITQGSNSQAKGLITINEIQHNEGYITHLTIHTLKDDEYIVEHQAYYCDEDNDIGKRDDSALVTIFGEDVVEEMQEEMLNENNQVVDVRYVVVYETTIPFFQLIKPNITNNYDTMSKMGIPVTANSVDVFKALDNAFNGLDNEAVNNYTVTVFSDKATKTKASTEAETGMTKYVQYIDKNNTRFISSPTNDNEDYVKHFNGEFQSDPYIAAINKHLSYGSFKMGMGFGYWSFDGTDVYVNEKQVISTNSALWKNKVKHEKQLRKAFMGLLKAIVFLETSEGRLSVNPEELEYTVKFDDSIIQDDETLKQNSLALVEKGAKPMWKHLVEWEGMTKKEAKQSVLDAIEESKLRTESFFGDVVDDTEIEDEPEE